MMKGSVNSLTYACSQCEKKFRTCTELESHQVLCKKCDVCNSYFKKGYLKQHQKSHVHKNALFVRISKNVEKIDKAFGDSVKIYKISSGGEISTKDFLEKSTDTVADILELELVQMGAFKYRLEISTLFYHKIQDLQSQRFFCSNYGLLTESDFVSDSIERHYDELVTEIEQYESRGSGWTMIVIQYLTIQLISFTPFRGGSYIKLPKWVQNKKAVINIRNKDEFCFLYCLAYALYGSNIKKNKQIASKYQKYFKNFNIGNLMFPLEITQIDSFLKINKHLDLSINVYSIIKKNSFNVLRVCEDERSTHIDLLLLESEDSFHYTYISDFSRLFRTKMTGHHKKLGHVCKKCLSYFYDEKSYSLHKTLNCSNYAYSFPKDYLQFEKFYARNLHKFLAFADIETLVVPIDGCENNPNEPYTLFHQKHVPFMTSLKWHSFNNDPNLDSIKIFKGRDCLIDFIYSLEEDVAYIFENYFKKQYEITELNDKAKAYLRQKFNDVCQICLKKIDFETDTFCIDHDHLLPPDKPHPQSKDDIFIGNARAYCHSKCNLNFQDKLWFNVFYHNARAFDMKFLVLALARLGKQMFVIPQSTENYHLVSWNVPLNDIHWSRAYIRIVDSYKMISSSLSELCKSLKKFPIYEDYILKKYGKIELNEKFFEKQVLFYEYLTEFNVLYQREFPPREAFYSSLSSTNVSDEDYQYARNLYKKLKFRNLMDYVEFYLISDTYFLMEVFLSFRSFLFDLYTVDIAYYISLPSYSFDCALSYSDVKLQIMKDVNSILFQNKGLRGGFCQGTIKFVEANHRHLKNFNIFQKETSILALDVCSLYSEIQCEYMLPEGDYTWLTELEISNILKNIQKYSEETEFGYIIECDISYPKELHDKHRDFPLLPTMRKMKGSGTKKLIADYFDRLNYVAHIKYIAMAVEKGLLLKKVHRGLKFRQSFFLRDYVRRNLSIRQDPQMPKFYTDVMKLCNNAIFGKTIENVENRRKIILVTGIQKLHRYVKSPRLKSVTLFASNLAAVELNKSNVDFDRPKAIGLSILDLSKMYMSTLFYDFLCVIFKDKLRNIYGDTDSFHLLTEGCCQLTLKKYNSFFDTSKYSPGNPYKIVPLNKKESGYLADENGCEIIKAFVYVTPKQYCYVTECNGRQGIKKKSKGTSKNIINRLTYENYYEAMKNKVQHTECSYRIGSQNLQVYTIKTNKKVLGTTCNKRYWLPNSVHSLPWGHYKIPKNITQPYDVV